MTGDLAKCRGFQWDEGNAEKNWVKHHVSRGKTEQVFFNRPLMVVAGESAPKPRRGTMRWGKLTPAGSCSSCFHP